jgi:hypothetical protein
MGLNSLTNTSAAIDIFSKWEREVRSTFGFFWSMVGMLGNT